MRLPTFLVVFVTCCCCLPGAAQQTPRTFRGSWMATAGAQNLRGKWTGQALPGRPNSARGTWELTSDSGASLMQGTWSAERQARAWQGTFVARTAGRVFSGRWTAYLDGADTTTLQQMLQRAIEKEVTGAWDSGARFGTWWLGGTMSGKPVIRRFESGSVPVVRVRGGLGPPRRRSVSQVQIGP